MGQTPTYQLPWPEANDPADVPKDLERLATKVEDALDLVEARMVNYGAWVADGTNNHELTATDLNNPKVIIDETRFTYGGPGNGGGTGADKFMTVPAGQFAQVFASYQCRWGFGWRTNITPQVATMWLQQRTRAIGAATWGPWTNFGFSPWWGANGVSPANIANTDSYANARWSEWKARLEGEYQFRLVAARDHPKGTTMGPIFCALVFAEVMTVGLVDRSQPQFGNWTPNAVNVTGDLDLNP